MSDPTFVELFAAPKSVEQKQLRYNLAAKYVGAGILWGSLSDIHQLLDILTEKFEIESESTSIFIKSRDIKHPINFYHLNRVQDDVAKAFFLLKESETPELAKAWMERCLKSGTELPAEWTEYLTEFLKECLRIFPPEFEKGYHLYIWEKYF
jgi:hypothetical protein